jgi:hypothetical protein
VVESIENMAIERLDIAGSIAAETTAAPLSCSREEGADLIAYAPFLKRIPTRIVGTDLQLKLRDDCISVVALAGEPLVASRRCSCWMTLVQRLLRRRPRQKSKSRGRRS